MDAEPNETDRADGAPAALVVGVALVAAVGAEWVGGGEGLVPGTFAVLGGAATVAVLFARVAVLRLVGRRRA